MHLIQQIGAYAGLAAIPGLAILSALYFSQARDVKRLREWAGRAPERAAEQAVGGRVVAQPQQAAQPATPGAQPAAATPGAAAATPAGQVAKPAQAAVTPAGVAAAAAKAGQAGKPAPSPAATPAGAAATAAAGSAPAVAAATGAGAATGAARGNSTGTVTRPGPPALGGVRPATPGAAASGAGAKPATAVKRPIPRITGSQTSILGPAGARAPEPWYRRALNRLPAGRYIALIVVGALVLGGGAAFGITQLTSKDSGSSGGGGSAVKSTSQPSSSGGGKHHAQAAPAIAPSSVTVTVVNGTTVANLARDTASKLSHLGFQIGNTVTGTGPLAAAESVVEYKPGARDKALFVANKLHINQKQPADADALAQAGPADVIVVLGADQAPGG